MPKTVDIINATPHDVTIVDESGSILFIFTKTDICIRLSAKVEHTGNLDGIPISQTVFGKPEGLPDYEFGVYYIVSQLVKSALPHRKDLLVPAEVVRDSNNNIIGCKSLGI